MTRKNNRYKHYKNKPNDKTVFKNIFKEGTLSMGKDNRAFVEYSASEKDIEVGIKDLGGAMHGDVVRIKLLSTSSSGRIRGVVSEVIERRQKKYIGTISKRGNRFLFTAEVSYPLPTFDVDTKQSITCKEGDTVIAEWLHWDSGNLPKVKIVELCSGWNKTKLVYHQLLFEQKFSVGFSQQVLQEAEKIKIDISPQTFTKRQDFRNVFTITIDPIDAKDFDDALSIRQVENNIYEIGVHIADVTHFVKPDSKINDEAENRTTSVYVPGYVEPMLPQKLSNDICSLVPHKDRLCFAVIFHIDKDSGKIVHHWISKTIINSNRRFTYEEVQEILDKQNTEYVDAINTINHIAQKWRAERIIQGSIDFVPSDKKIVLSIQQEVERIEIEETNESHQLIEEFMLMANQYVARFLSTQKNRIPFPNRVHDLPNEEKLNEFVHFAKSKGFTVNPNPKLLPASLNAMIQQATQRDKRSPLPYLAIRCMAKAQYSIDPIGHYGLGFEYYAHFTSPIRRYPDMILHRILENCLDHMPPTIPHLQAICNRCNEREKAAMLVEREAKKYKTIEFIQPHIGATFGAIISGVSDRGIWAEIDDYFAEGFISMNELMLIDKFSFLPNLFCIKGAKSGKKLEVGGRIKVKILSASLEERKINLQWVH